MISRIVYHPDPEQALSLALKIKQDTTGIQHSDNDPDYSLINPEKGESIKIEQIRDLSKHIHIKPLKSTIKTIIIHQAHQLTPAAQQALLKTLEEPPEFAQLILTTTQLDQLLPTILSRGIIHRPTDISKPPLSEELQKQFSELFQSPPFLRLATTNKFANDRTKAQEFCEQLLAFLHVAMTTPHQNIFKGTQTQLLQSARWTLKAAAYLHANVNITLAMDHLFLQLPQTPK